jgi:putative inorganic carbon (hco3(-)) transporter
MNSLGFYLYLLFTVSWFSHLTARIPSLGAVRFDLLLAFILCALHFTFKGDQDEGDYFDSSRKLKYLIITIACITPFAEFPGSVLRFGIPNFAKAVAFYYFTIWFVDTQWKLLIFLQTFIFCQTFRILEPLYLHLTSRYWGSKASMAGWEYMDRLSGAPFDVINPNGLAYVILTVLSFMTAFWGFSRYWNSLIIVLAPLLVYAMVLTGSRSGLLGVLFLAALAIYKSAKKARYLVLAGALSLVFIHSISDTQLDRYNSIVSSDAKNAQTASGRINGLLNDLVVGFNNPIVGFGLGTSLEANANFGNVAKPSHNIFIEVFQELGLVGLFVFLMYIKSIFLNIFSEETGSEYSEPPFLSGMKKALASFAQVTLFFGLFSYGLSSYEWYLIGGLTVSVASLCRDLKRIEA